MSLVEEIRAKLDAKCSTWGCPQGTTLYDDLHPCTEALCRFRDYFTYGATEQQWRELSHAVDAIHAVEWPKFLAKILRANLITLQKYTHGNIFYYRGNIHSRRKANRLVEKINTELDRAVAADPSIARNYFVRAEAMIGELESISRGRITSTIVIVVIVILIILILYFASPCNFAAKKYYHGS